MRLPRFLRGPDEVRQHFVGLNVEAVCHGLGSTD